MKRAFILALLVFLTSFSFASQIWEYSTEGPITTKPVVFQNAVVVASDDGKVYAIDPGTGSRRWEAAVGDSPNEVFLFDGGVVSSSGDGNVVKFGANGAVVWKLDLNVTPYNVTHIYGASGNANEIFVAADNGIYLVGKDGSVKSKLMSYNSTISGPPTAGTDFVIVGRGNELDRISDTGAVQWRSKLLQGTFWLSRPVISGTNVYIGALDNRVHAYLLNGGSELWSTETKNWVVSTPLVLNGVVYVGSDDGNVYSLDATTGSVNWAAQTQLAVQSEPEAGTMGGKDVIFAGSTDKSIYAIARDTGEIVWKGPSAGSVASPMFYQNSVIFGAGDDKIYAFSTERACSITDPHEADIVGLKELVVDGKYASESGGGQVNVQINGGAWQPTNTSDVDWVYYIDPKAQLNPGLNTISCMVSDSAGQESGPGFTSVAINFDPTISLSNLVVTIPSNVVEGQPFTIFVNDGDDGSPVDRFNLTFDGKTYFSDRNVTIPSAPSAGSYDIKVTKIGFNDAAAKVNVNSSGVNPIFIALGVLVIIVLIWFVWTRFIGQRFAPRRR